MTWTPELKSLLQRFAAKFPAPTAGDESARTWTRHFAEQVCYALGTAWGTKAQTASHPQSTDSLAYRDARAQRLYSWDLLYSSGSPSCKIIYDPSDTDITGQYFIAVSPVNHLATDPPPPPPPPPSGDLDERVAEVEVLVARILTFLSQTFKTWR